MDLSYLFEADKRFEKVPLSKTEYWANDINENPEKLRLILDKWWEEASKITRSFEFYDGEEVHYQHAGIYSETDALLQIAKVIQRLALNTTPYICCQSLFSFWMACNIGDENPEQQVEIALTERCRAFASLNTLSIALKTDAMPVIENDDAFIDAKTAGLRLALMYILYPRSQDWKAPKLAKSLKCEESTIRHTEAWQGMQRKKKGIKNDARNKYTGEISDDHIYENLD